MFKWKVNFDEKPNIIKDMMEKVLPLDIMRMDNKDLNIQFEVTPGDHEYTSRELIFKFYESNDCKIFHLSGSYSIKAVTELLSELPPVYIFHAELSLTTEEFLDLTKLNVLNAVYAIKINGYTGLFLKNLEKIINADLKFYWVE